MPFPTGPNWPDAVRPLELQRRARVIANMAEYLAEDIRDDPSRALQAMGALAEWCEGDPELLAHARTVVLRDRRRGRMSAVRNNRHAVQLLDLVGASK